MLALDEQSPNIAAGVHINRSIEDLGAGDQVTKVYNIMHTHHSFIFVFFLFHYKSVVFLYRIISHSL